MEEARGCPERGESVVGLRWTDFRSLFRQNLCPLIRKEGKKLMLAGVRLADSYWDSIDVHSRMIARTTRNQKNSEQQWYTSSHHELEETYVCKTDRVSSAGQYVLPLGLLNGMGS